MPHFAWQPVGFARQGAGLRDSDELKDAGTQDADKEVQATDPPPPTGLEDLLDRLAQAKEEGGEIRIGRLLEAIGRRSFGPLLLMAGLIAVSPLSGIPGMPTTIAITVSLVAVQFLLGQRHFWVPRWVQERRVSHARFCEAVRLMKRPARVIDRFLKPRFEMLTHEAGIHAIAVLSLVIAATMPPLEIVPFAATSAGLALTTFGLSLITGDGLVALVALVLTAGVAGLLLYGIL
jgi:hypothetical protein